MAMSRNKIRAAGIAALALAALLLPPLQAQAQAQAQSQAQAQAQILTLDKALEIAFRNSPSVQEARYALTISGENLKAQQAGLKSQFLLTLTPLTLSKARTFSDLTSRYNTQDLTKSALRFSITQPIKWTDRTLIVSNAFVAERRQSYTGFIPESTFNNSSPSPDSARSSPTTGPRCRSASSSCRSSSQINYSLQKLSIRRQVTSSSSASIRPRRASRSAKRS
jgi:hypothetical protein